MNEFLGAIWVHLLSDVKRVPSEGVQGFLEIHGVTLGLFSEFEGLIASWMGLHAGADCARARMRCLLRGLFPLKSSRSRIEALDGALRRCP
jgi:hypothetical protein